MIRLTTLLITLVLALPLAARAQEESLIAAYRADITEMRDATDTTPALGVVRSRLSRAFIENDIIFSRRYLDNWSVLLQDRWTQLDAFFATQLDALSAWDQALSDGTVTPDEAEAALAPAMARIGMVADRIDDWLDDDTARMTERAFWTDLAQEIGCCDALYYHALSEAGGVWGVALSPDPAAIAALQLVPAVPGSDGSDVTTAERAFAWLASRADALLTDDAVSPARRRALLVEASLLEDLFGLPSDGALEVSLSAMAIREGFAAQPVAPLIRMASLTEPGPLRDLLLERATTRLASRAEYLRPIALRADAAAEAAPARRSVTASVASTRQMAGTSMVVPPTADVAPASPTPTATAPTSSDHLAESEAADLVDQALAALLQARTGDIGVFIDSAEMAEQADALIGSGTSVDLVDALTPETR